MQHNNIMSSNVNVFVYEFKCISFNTQFRGLAEFGCVVSWKKGLLHCRILSPQILTSSSSPAPHLRFVDNVQIPPPPTHAILESPADYEHQIAGTKKYRL